jgi:hypothetical protein
VGERTRVINQLQAPNATAQIILGERVGDGTGKQLERRILPRDARTPRRQPRGAVAFALMRDLTAVSDGKLLACDPTRFKNEAASARCNGTPIPAEPDRVPRRLGF